MAHSEFFYTSQLATEAAPDDDFHFTPGNRRNVRGWVRVYF